MNDHDSLVREFGDDGVAFAARSGRANWLFEPLSMGNDAACTSLLSQLEEQGFAFFDDGEICLTWPQLVQVQCSPEYEASYALLGLPPTSDLRPSLGSNGSFSDPDFSVYVAGWIKPDGTLLRENPRVTGALITTTEREAILAPAVWRTIRAVSTFHRRRPAERTAESNRAAWGEIRKHAKSAKADLSHFLESTIVITPERLAIDLRKSEIAGGKVIEVFPTFEGQPPNWIETFDRFDQVRQRYEVPHGEGLTHVVIAPEVRSVLEEIKRMPARRVVGERAEAFVRNPFAILGPTANGVINPDQFENARETAGISFARFTAQIQNDSDGSVLSVGLLIEEGSGPTISSEYLPFTGPQQLEKFIGRIEDRIKREAECCAWQGNDLEILGDTPDQIETLRAALRQWSLPGSFKATEILDLSQYSERIEGFGLEKPYFSPFISRKSAGDGWFPENVIFGLEYTPDESEIPIAIEFSELTFRQFSEELQRAKDEHRSSFSFSGLPKPIEVSQAEAMLNVFRSVQIDVAKDRFDLIGDPDLQPIKKNGLVVKPNVERVDYREHRGTLSLPSEVQACLPGTLRSDATLRDHQLTGVAWLQHLWSLSPTSCRGALLADDMGLGKTIQLLAFIANCLEQNSNIDPFLIVAPVSLLENWQEEIDKFFNPGTLPVLMLYGSALREKRLPQSAINEDLLTAGISRLLIRDWLGNAKVVLTTYETLRDLEFSLARQKWSVMVCDEAQKIKTPNAMVSRSAKKQNARFKIACTGTPVENTLTDLWCLFDFIQPGLLGALTDFGNTYRRPIEAETDEERVRVEELRKIIEPQTLRRIKADVAKDLPLKVVDSNCRALTISPRQRSLYAQGIASFRTATTSAGESNLRSHLGLLSYLRAVCSDPRPPGRAMPELQSIAELEEHSPKMAWMLSQLQSIRDRGEKVIVFCEFRELQRTLQRAIAERLDVSADIINGDTPAASVHADNRQKRIKKFQETEGFGVIILSPLAVGFGLNIQAANHVIHFTRTWNPAREDQATDRAYRIGQTKDVHVYYPVVVAEDFTTFDQKLDQLLETKRKLSQDMLNGCGDVGSSDFADLHDPTGGALFDMKPVT
jgi:hypothetical protein